MHVIAGTDGELRLPVNALRSFLEDLGHEEADLLRQIRALIATLEQS